MGTTKEATITGGPFPVEVEEDLSSLNVRIADKGLRVVHTPLTTRTVTRHGGIEVLTKKTGYVTFIAVPTSKPRGYFVAAAFCEPGDTFSRSFGIQHAMEHLMEYLNQPETDGEIGSHALYFPHHVFSGQSLFEIADHILALDLLNMPEWCVQMTKTLRR